ncbi:uncharacterized protein METZ01_LOCUS489673, partial [marine metagenome]
MPCPKYETKCRGLFDAKNLQGSAENSTDALFFVVPLHRNHASVGVTHTRRAAMYGMVNKAIRNCVIEHYSEDVWCSAGRSRCSP